jgi:hypothetical protein
MKLLLRYFQLSLEIGIGDDGPIHFGCFGGGSPSANTKPMEPEMRIMNDSANRMDVFIME